MNKCFFFLLLIASISCQMPYARKNSYSIGRDPTWFPLQIELHVDSLNGFTNALVQEISKLEHVPLHLFEEDWAQLFEQLEKGEYGGVFSSLSPNVISEAKYSFSKPFLLLGPVLVVPINSTASTLEDLEGKIVAVNQFDDSILIVMRYPSIVTTLYQNKPTALENLTHGDYDAVLMPILDAQALISHRYATQLKIVSKPLNNKALRLLTLKDASKSLMNHFNQGLEKMILSGQYQILKNTFSLD